MELDEPNKLLNSNFLDESILNYPAKMSTVDNEAIIPSYKVELTTKKAVELLLEGSLRSKVCRYCLCVASPLSDLDQIMQIAGKGTLYKVTIRDMVACFHPFKAQNDPNFPRKICNKCLNRTISAYLFTQQCEQSERALRNCFDDMYAKLEKLDPLDKTKKRGRQKRNPNYNVLYADHGKVMDYAEPIRHIVNTKTVSLSDEKYMSDLECPKCWQIFSKVEDLVVHEKTHPSNMWFNCRLCGKSFVKRLQFKRHLKQAHGRPETTVEENHIFQCGTCGFSCDDHSIHLQHIEKHKFQSVLEHLVEKKMDKLCTVCFDKKPKLVELDKMVRLHGGYPGVTGDKSLYSILGSTLPDRKSYKYQELHVPHHANIMKFVKLTKDKKPQKKSLYSSGSNMNQIIISNPLVISNDKFDCDEMFLYFFSGPSYYKDNNTESYSLDRKYPSNIVTQCSKDQEESVSTMTKEETNNHSIVKETCVRDEIGGSMHNVNDTLSIRNVVDDNDKVNVNENKIIEKKTPINETPCKVCWIFKEPICKTCIDKQVNIDARADSQETNDVSNNTKGKCKYCWLFKTSDKCDVCKTPASAANSNITASTNVTASTVTPGNMNAESERKRKLTDDVSQPKNKKWNCQICLTNNAAERVTCICCECNRSSQNYLFKVNLDCKSPFKIFKINKPSRHEDTVAQTFTPLDENEIQEDIPMVEIKNIIPMANVVHFDKLHYPSIGDTIKTLEFPKPVEDTEEMDISDEDNTQIIITPNQNALSFTIAHSSNIAAQSSNITDQLASLEQSSNMLLSNSDLTFNIGAGSSIKMTKSGRKIMRPIRRMAYLK